MYSSESYCFPNDIEVDRSVPYRLSTLEEGGLYYAVEGQAHNHSCSLLHVLGVLPYFMFTQPDRRCYAMLYYVWGVAANWELEQYRKWVGEIDGGPKVLTLIFDDEYVFYRFRFTNPNLLHLPRLM